MFKKNTYLLLTIGILLLILFLSCSTSPEPVVESIPEWVESIPQDNAYYFALGVSGPLPRANEAWEQAIRRARAELGRLIISHVSSSDAIIASSRGEYVQQIVEILSDTELNYTEVIERWFDKSGAYGFREHYYVLVRMEKKTAKTILRSIK